MSVIVMWDDFDSLDLIFVFSTTSQFGSGALEDLMKHLLTEHMPVSCKNVPIAVCLVVGMPAVYNT